MDKGTIEPTPAIVPAPKKTSHTKLFLAVAVIAIIVVVGAVYASGMLTPQVELTGVQVTLIYKIGTASSTQIVQQPNIAGKYPAGQSLDISWPLSNTAGTGWTVRATKVESQTTGFTVSGTTPSLPVTAPLTGSTVIHIYFALPTGSYKGPLYYTVTYEQIVA